MKGNVYVKRPISHRGMYLNIDMRKHHSRECHTPSRTHTYTHCPSQLSIPYTHLHVLSRKSNSPQKLTPYCWVNPTRSPTHLTLLPISMRWNQCIPLKYIVSLD